MAHMGCHPREYTLNGRRHGSKINTKIKAMRPLDCYARITPSDARVRKYCRPFSLLTDSEKDDAVIDLPYKKNRRTKKMVPVRLGPGEINHPPRRASTSDNADQGVPDAVVINGP